MRAGIEQGVGRLLPPADRRLGSGIRHLPASHPGLQRQRLRPIGPVGVAGTRSWHEELIGRVEADVALLDGEILTMDHIDRYERALVRGHIDNLRRVRSRQED